MSTILIPAVSALSNALNSKQNTHAGLRQQLIATQIKNLSNQINELVSNYDSLLQSLNQTRKALTKARKASSVADVARLKGEIHVLERQVLSSQLPFEIAGLRVKLNLLNSKIIEI